MVARVTALLAFLFVSVALADDPPKLPPPAERTKATAAVVEVFGAEAAKAKTPAAFTALAIQVRKAADSEKDVAARWALLDYARLQAIQAGDAKLIFQIIGELDADYGYGPQASLDTGERLAKIGRGTPDLVDLMIGFVESAHVKDDFAALERIAGGAVTMANSAKDSSAAKYFTYFQKRAPELGKKFAAVKEDRDAKARFVFFDKLDLKTGIPLLAACKDPKLVAAAEKDVKADAGTVADQMAAIEAWWQLAENATAGEKLALLSAAQLACNRVTAELTGLEKAKFENRLKQVMDAIEVEEAKNGLFLTFVGTWNFETKDGVTQEFTVHRSGRIAFDPPVPIRVNLVRVGKDVLMRHPAETSKWTVSGNTLTMNLFTPTGMKPTGTITARRK